MGRKTAVVNIRLLFEKQHSLVTGSWKKLKWWTGERGRRRQAVTEERRKSRSVFSTVSLRVVLRYLLAQARFECFEQIVLWQENGSPELKIEQKWSKMWIDGARNSYWMERLLMDGRSQKGQVGTGGWEEDEWSGEKEGSGQEEGNSLLEGWGRQPPSLRRVSMCRLFSASWPHVKGQDL